MWDHAYEARRMDRLERADEQQRREQTCLIRYYDKYLEEVGEEGAYSSIQCTWKRRGAGGLKMTIPRPDMVHFDHFFHNPDGDDATIPITVNIPGKRWDGFVTRAALLRDEFGVETVDIEAIHCKQHHATTLMYPSPFAPIWAQWPRHMIGIGPLVTQWMVYYACNLIRQQALGAPESWTDAPDWAKQDALWPIAIKPVDILHDTSPWRALIARMDPGDSLFLPAAEGSGVMFDAQFFLPGEDEQPAPEYFWLERPTVVLSAENFDALTGPTGTLLDGLLGWFEEWIDDTTPVRYPNFAAQSEYEAVYGNRGPLGTVRGLPWVWFLEGEYSGIGTSEVAIHKPTATHVVVGGKSPGWVNAAIEFAIKQLLAWLGMLIGLPGLDALYRGQLDDVFLAWAVYEDRERTRRAGPFAFKEIYITGSDKAYTLDGVMAGLGGLHQTRGYTSKKVSVDPLGGSYVFGRDYDLGHQIGFQVGADLLFTDYVDEATFTDDRTTAADLALVIGDGSDEEDSLVKAWDQMGSLAAAIKQLFTDVGADLDLIIL